MSESAPRYVTCPCQYCSGRIEFDANQLDPAANTLVSCPHCGLETIVFEPPTQPGHQVMLPVPPVIETAGSDQGIQWYKQALSVLKLDQGITPATVEGFAGQERIKKKAGNAFEEAEKRGERPPHILLIGPQGSGKTSLALLIARAFANTAGTNCRVCNARGFDEVRDFAEFLASVGGGDICFLDDIDLLVPTIADQIPSVTVDRDFDIGSWLGSSLPPSKPSISQSIIENLPRSNVGNLSRLVVELVGLLGSKSSVRPAETKLPRFTLIATATEKEKLSPFLLACFQVVEELDTYSAQEMEEITSRLTMNLGLEIDQAAVELIAIRAGGIPKSLPTILELIRVYTRARSSSRRITYEMVTEAFRTLLPQLPSDEESRRRQSVPSAVRREVWRRDDGKCSKCGSRVNLEYDHIVPVAKGGSNTARNIELLCESCNRSKSDSIQ